MQNTKEKNIQETNRHNNLKKSKIFLANINKKLYHKIMLPLNPVCFVPSKIYSTNNVLI